MLFLFYVFDSDIYLFILCFHLLPPDSLGNFECFYGVTQRWGEGVADFVDLFFLVDVSQQC